MVTLYSVSIVLCPALRLFLASDVAVILLVVVLDHLGDNFARIDLALEYLGADVPDRHVVTTVLGLDAGEKFNRKLVLALKDDLIALIKVWQHKNQYEFSMKSSIESGPCAF